MKKIIILLTILISTIFSNVAFADIMVPWQYCNNYDNNCYNECLNKKWNTQSETDLHEEGNCIDKCCIKNKIICKKPFYLLYCTKIKWEFYPTCKHNTYWDCTDSKDVVKIIFTKTDISIFWLFRPSEFYILLFILSIIWIFVYKRKKIEKW